MRRRPIFCADINLAAAEKTAGIIRSEGGEAVANRADEEQTSPTAANLALLRRTNATAHYSIEAICIGALWCADRTLPGVTPTKNHDNCPLSVDALATHQNGFTTARITITAIKIAGISLIMR